MKVLAINGSARKNGNTARLLTHVFAPLEEAGIETEMIQLGGESIAPCRACWGCGAGGTCVIQHDRFQEIFEKMQTADGILLASPVYTGNMSANLQALLERLSVVSDMNRQTPFFRYKVGAAVTVARRGGALSTLDAINHFFLLQQMVVVGSTYWPLAYGQMPEDAAHDNEGLSTMRTLGENIAHVLKALASHPVD